MIEVGNNIVTAQRVVPLKKLRPGFRHLRLHNELDQPLPLSQLFLCTQFLDGDIVIEPPGPGQGTSGSGAASASSSPTLASPGIPNKSQPEPIRKRMSFLVVHDISESAPYAILKVQENATTRDVIKQAVAKAGEVGTEHEYVLLEEAVAPR